MSIFGFCVINRHDSSFVFRYVTEYKKCDFDKFIALAKQHLSQTQNLTIETNSSTHNFHIFNGMKYQYIASTPKIFPTSILYGDNMKTGFFTVLDSYVMSFDQIEKKWSSAKHFKKFSEMINEHSDIFGSKIDKVQNQVNDLSEMTQNLVSIAIDRHDKIENLESSTKRLSEHSLEFERKSTKLKWYVKLKNIKMTLLIFFVILIIVAIVTFLLYSMNG